MLVGAHVEAADLGVRLDALAVFLIALHRAVREAQREGAVGIGGVALRREHRLGDLRVGVALDGQHFVVVLLAQLARARLDQARHLDERIAWTP